MNLNARNNRRPSVSTSPEPAGALRWGSAAEAKQHGTHYTPPELARFLASLALAACGRRRRLSVLDPACGDGELLAAVAETSKIARRHMRLAGLDRDRGAIETARRRLASFGVAVDLRADDFLGSASGGGLLDGFDLVIANPPYVRTQVIGAATARRLASRLHLSGRVDLYHAFAQAMTRALGPGGVLALLCSNRFLSTSSGESLRTTLSDDFDILRIIDLGDTKLFEAAVLPAIVIARRRAPRPGVAARFTRVYEARDRSEDGSAPSYSTVVGALLDDVEGHVKVGDATFLIEDGELRTDGDPGKAWNPTTADSARWLSRVQAHTAHTFGDVGHVRVGIKSTADSVFIRDDWHELAADVRPEPDLLHDLITHHIAEKWRPRRAEHPKRVLYPHIAPRGRMLAVDLGAYPKANAYLSMHRDRLAKRPYIVRTGRQWFEIWVTQNPSAWRAPKVVFPDIAELPRAFLDTSGAIVNGDCYWVTLRRGFDEGYLRLMLAVINSSLSIRFYDTVCGNRLYEGRRRFISQYVKRFPLPALDTPLAKRASDLVSELLAGRPRSDLARTQRELDRTVWRLFGVGAATT